MARRYDVYGMCNPLYDIESEVTDAFVHDLGLTKGGMFLVDGDTQADLVDRVQERTVNAAAGGSGANTMIGVAMLGGAAFYTGKIADDQRGRLYRTGLQARGVVFSTAPGAGSTGLCLVLITPDAERTMVTHLGVSRDLGPDDVDPAALGRSAYLYMTAYLWDTDSQKEAVLRAMRLARDSGVKVAISLSDPFCVRRHKADLRQLIAEHVDLVFGNEDETQELTDTHSPVDAVRATKDVCRLAAVTMSERGSLIRDGDRVHEIPPFPVRPVDVSGAGDVYAAALLYGLTHEVELLTTGRLASYLAAQVVAKLGPRLDSWDRSAIDSILAA